MLSALCISPVSAQDRADRQSLADSGFKHSENTQTHFPEYFPVERNACWKDCLVSVCESRNGIFSLENAAFEFDLPYWGKILIITTEHGPCDRNPEGHTIHQMMFNVQVLGGGWEGNGGDGWLRILEFKPDGKTISVRTYSPLFGISHITKHLAHRRGACDEFNMVVE